MAFYVRAEVRERSTGIVDMVRRASHKKNRIAMLAGFIAGGWIPTVTYLVSLPRSSSTAVVASCVWWPDLQCHDRVQLGEDRFRHPLKALGFVVLLEGAMTFVPDWWIGLPSLGLLILINGLATGTNLVNDSRESRLLARGKPRRR